MLGQVAFEFDLSIAQILVSLLTCAVLEVGIAFRRQRVLMWPASALLTGNGVAFILRVPGTEHGDWWSMHGWWIFAATAAVALLSKYLIHFRGRHVFNPSNFGLVLASCSSGSSRADPLEFWWGPMSAWMALALAIIVVGGLVILSRLRLLAIAVVLLARVRGRHRRARGQRPRHDRALAPRADHGLGVLARARLLARDPRLPLLHDHRPEDDPRRAVPGGACTRSAIALVAVLLIAPQTTEFATKVAVLAALALVCAARPVGEIILSRRSLLRVPSLSRARVGALALAGAAVFAGLVVLAGIPARTSEAAAGPVVNVSELPEVTVVPSDDVSTQLDRETALKIASDLVSGLRTESEALASGDAELAATVAGGARLAGLFQQMAGDAVVPDYHVERVRLTLHVGEGQGPPVVVAELEGTVAVTSGGQQGDPRPFAQTLELELQDGRYLIVGSRGGADLIATGPPVARAGLGLGAVRLVDVARHVGLDFRHGAFRFKTSPDPVAMMGGGVCWLDFDGDGWLDLYAVNSHSIQVDVAALEGAGRAAAQRALPQREGQVRRSEPRLRAPACNCAGTAAWPRTSTATGAPISTSPPPGTTRSCGTWAGGSSPRERAQPASTRTAGTRPPRSPT